MAKAAECRRQISSEHEPCSGRKAFGASHLGNDTRVMEQMLAEAQFEEIVRRVGQTVTYAAGETILQCNEKQVVLFFMH